MIQLPLKSGCTWRKFRQKRGTGWMRENCCWVVGTLARNKGVKGKGRSLKGHFLSGANRRAVWLVNPKMHSTDPLILHVLHAANFGALCNHYWLYLCTSHLQFKFHSYRNCLFTMVFSVNYHCHHCYDCWRGSLHLIVLLFHHKFMHPLCSGIVKCSFCVVWSIWGL